MAEIAEEFRDECAQEFPDLKKCPDFEEVLKHAAESRDGELVEVARKFLPQAQTVRKTISHEMRFIGSEGDDYFRLIVGAIDSAQRSIMIMAPVLNEEGVFDALARAQKRGVRDVYVITQLSEHRNNIFKTDPQFRNYELPRRRLAALGVNVRDCEHTVHAKMIIVDSTWMFFTTANFNANSLGVGGANAIEAGIEYKDVSVARAGEKLFWEVWSGASYRQIRNDDRIAIASVQQQREIRVVASVQRRRGCTFLLSTPENQLLMRKMCSLIARAKREIRMLTMSFYDLKEVPALFRELMRALERGVKVTVGVRANEFPPHLWPDPSTKELQEAGLGLCERENLHAKGMVVDGSEVLMTSANFNPFSLGNSRTAHIEMAVFGSTELKPLTSFADFVDKALA